MTERERLEVIVTAFAKALIGSVPEHRGKKPGRQRRPRLAQQLPLYKYEEPAPTIRELDEQFQSILRSNGQRIPDLDFEDEDLEAVDMTQSQGPGMN